MNGHPIQGRNHQQNYKTLDPQCDAISNSIYQHNVTESDLPEQIHQRT